MQMTADTVALAALIIEAVLLGISLLPQLTLRWQRILVVLMVLVMVAAALVCFRAEAGHWPALQR